MTDYIIPFVMNDQLGFRLFTSVEFMNKIQFIDQPLDLFLNCLEKM